MKKLGEPKQDTNASGPATVVIKAPLDVRVKVNGELTSRSSAEEAFATPTLQPGRTYSYQVTMEAERDGKTVTKTEKVLVRANQESRVDFSTMGAPSEPARVTVLAPDGARVFVDGVSVSIGADQRSFETPKLEPGKQYYYTIKAELEQDGRTRTESQRVIVAAGKAVTVEFKNLTAVQTASR
jgi:uncharacterized protein (TIGR03000 family)